MSRVFNFLFPFGDFLWILQKEEYETGRYLSWLPRFFFRRNFLVTEKLALTTRAKLILLLAWLLFFLKIAASRIIFGHEPLLFFIPLALIGTPVFVLVAHLLVLPFAMLGHSRARAKARVLVASNPALKVIGIAGSYGKTTTKHFVYELVRHAYRTQMIPGNINTLTGIAEWLSKNLKRDTELLVLEMDAYHSGEIAATCRIAPPNIGILTSVGEQHLMRFRTLERLKATLYELKSNLKPNGTFIEGVHGLSYKGKPLVANQLSASNKENLSRALRAAELLDIPAAFVEDTIPQLTEPERRQKLGQVLGYDGVDDSYNISLSTARAGLAAARELANAKQRRLLVVAAGIPELGQQEMDGNILLGEAIAEEANAVIVLGTMFSTDIQQGINAKIPTESYKRLEDFMKDAHKKYPPSEWVLLLQPALPDLFY